MSINISKTGILTSSGTVGKNLIANSLINQTSSAYGFGGRSFNITNGVTYTVQARGYISKEAASEGTTLKVYFYKSNWSYCPVILSIDSTSPKTVKATFTADRTITLSVTSYSFKSQSTAGSAVTTIWYKAEEGSTPTIWTPNSSDSIYIGEDIGFAEECINPNIASFTKAGHAACRMRSDRLSDVYGGSRRSAVPHDR